MIYNKIRRNPFEIIPQILILSLLSVDHTPPHITNCDLGIDLRVDNFTSTIAERYENGSYFYNWTFPSAVDGSNPDIELKPYNQTRQRDDKLFYPGTTTVSFTFTNLYGYISECSFDVIVRKYKGVPIK